jgi:hypothetical protein
MLWRTPQSFICRHCGKPFRPKLACHIQQKFCGATCRKSAARALKFPARYPYSGVSRAKPKIATNSKASKSGFGDRPSPIFGPPAVIRAELFACRDWASVTSPDGVVVMVATLGSRHA